MILLQTLIIGHPLSRITGVGSESVLPLRSAAPEADGTGDSKGSGIPSLGGFYFVSMIKKQMLPPSTQLF